MALSKNISVFLTLNTKQFQSQITKTTKSMRAFGTSMQSIGSSITRNFSIPFALLGGVATKTALDFDKSMTKIRTLVGISGKEVSRFSEEVRNLSKETGVSANELAQALFDITSAGLRGDAALQALEMSAKASAIGLGDTKSVASALSGVMNAYAGSNLTAAEATDILLKTVREGKLEAESLAPVLGRVTPLAAQLGIGFEEVGASIATFTKLGVSAEEAATGLRGVLNAIIKPTGEAELALKSYGLSIEQIRKMAGERGLMLTLKHLMDTFGDNDQAIASMFGNVRALTTVLGTAGAQAETYEQVLASLTDSQGALNDAFKVVENTASFQLAQAMQQLKDAMIELGQALVPVILKFSEFITNLIKKFRNLNPETKQFVAQLAVAFAVGGPILTGIGFLISNLATVTTAMAKFVLNNPKLALMAAAIGLIAYYWDDVKVAIAQVANYMIDLYNNSAFVRGMLNGILATLATMGGIIVTVFNLIVYTVEWAVKKIEDIFKKSKEIFADAANTFSIDLGDPLGVNKAVHDIFGQGDEYDKIRENDPLWMQKPDWHDILNTGGSDSENFWEDEEEFVEKSMSAIEDFITKADNIWNNAFDETKQGKIDIEVTPDDLQAGVDNIKNNITSGMSGIFNELMSMMGMDGGFTAIGGGDDSSTGTTGTTGTGNDVVLGLDLGEQKGKFQTFVDDIKTSWLEGVKIMGQEFENFAVKFGEGMSSALSTAIVEGQSMKDAFRDFMKSMTQEVLKMIIKTLVLRTIMKALGLPVGAMSLGAGLDQMAGITPVGDIAFGPSSGRYIVGPEGAFSLSPNDSIIAGTNLFGGGGGPSNMTVDGYIDGSSIMLSNQRETNTTNRLS
tara:strand:- start:562 stop:3117 length:2556 start_codon:yes stop_codon:yes gene_type:complete